MCSALESSIGLLLELAEAVELSSCEASVSSCEPETPSVVSRRASVTPQQPQGGVGLNLFDRKISRQDDEVTFLGGLDNCEPVE